MVAILLVQGFFSTITKSSQFGLVFRQPSLSLVPHILKVEGENIEASCVYRFNYYSNCLTVRLGEHKDFTPSNLLPKL